MNLEGYLIQVTGLRIWLLLIRKHGRSVKKCVLKTMKTTLKPKLYT